MTSDESLVERAKAGSDDAFQELVRMHQVQVHAFLGRFIRDLEAVDDLAQETFLSAYRHMGSFRGESSFRTWLFGIARNAALMHLRSERSRRKREVKALDAAVAAYVSARAESDAFPPSRHVRRMSALEKCLEELPGKNARLVDEFYVRGLSAAEIARRAGRKEGALRMALMRIRQALRACIERRLAGEPA